MEFGFLIYPIRALQALFSIIVLSVLSYGSHPPPLFPPSLTPLPSISLLDLSAQLDALTNQFPNLRIRMDATRASIPGTRAALFQG
jgi:hypothetical protein